MRRLSIIIIILCCGAAAAAADPIDLFTIDPPIDRQAVGWMMMMLLCMKEKYQSCVQCEGIPIKLGMSQPNPTTSSWMT